MDNSLVQTLNYVTDYSRTCLNPCCNGQQSSTKLSKAQCRQGDCLNPCCNGQQSSTRPNKTILIINKLKNRAKQIFIFINRKLTISQRVQRYYFFLRYASQLFLIFLVFYASEFHSINNKHKGIPKALYDIRINNTTVKP